MLQKLKSKIQGTEFEQRIILHPCGENKIDVPEPVDFVLVFYMLHEVPHQEGFLKEIESLLKPDGQVLVVEPPFHVSRLAFEETIRKARNAGLALVERPKVCFSKTAVFKKSQRIA